MRLTDDELRDVLARAEEIQRASRYGAEMNAELEAVIGAAEEIGLARPAVERALRERLDLSATPPAVGTLAFAKSADDKFYVAEVLSISTDGVRVRFLRGGEHLVSPDQLRPCSFIPGERISCNWPWWGPWTCTVVAYDAATNYVELSDGWGSTETFPIAEVWIAPPQKADVARGARRRAYMTLIGAGRRPGRPTRVDRHGVVDALMPSIERPTPSVQLLDHAPRWSEKAERPLCDMARR